MNATGRASPGRVPLWLGAVVFAALHGLGIYAYVTRYVLKHVWLWDNPDYMLYLYAAYFHLHMIVLAGHLYVWGPYLIWRRYRVRWWSLYYVSFASAYVFTLIPLLAVQRVAALDGALAYWVIVVYALLLLAYVARYLIGSRARATLVALHVFAGFPMAALFFLSTSLLGAILILHVGAAWYLERRAGLGEATPAEPPRAGGSLLPVRVANSVLVVVIAAVTLLNFQFNLLYGRHILLGILDKAAYPPPVDPSTATTATPTRDQLRFRSTDGSWNNLEHPEIGRAGTPLGRYLPAVAATPQDVYREPSVLKVSERLMKQKQFIPAATSNGTISALAFAGQLFRARLLRARHRVLARGDRAVQAAGG
jgi:Animal haem peroxidase